MLSRREFLTAAAVGTVIGPAVTLGAAATPRRVPLAPETGLFEATAGGDVRDQIALAAEWGFPAFLDAGLLQRSPAEAEAIVTALASFDLTPGPPRGPAVPASPQGLRRWRDDVRQTLSLIKTWQIAGLRLDYGPATYSWMSAGLSRQERREALRRLADAAQRQESVLLLEPWDDGRAGQCVFTSAQDLVQSCEHPALKLSVDTYRWAAAGFHLANVFADAADIIGHVELADFPGGCEPGTGLLPLATCLRQLLASGYTGVIGLRHGTSQTGIAGDQLVRTACARLTSAVTSSSLG